MEYRIMWEIDVDAESPEQADKMARSMQSDPNTTATICYVFNENGDFTLVDTAKDI